jgi:ABC-type multidrug transport system fused ATPase/permease subunit
MLPLENPVRVSPGEFFKISWWSLKFVFNLQPFYSVTYIISGSLQQVLPLVNSFIFAKGLDLLITAIKTPGTPVSVLYPYLLALLVFNIFSRLLSISNSLSVSSLNTFAPQKIRQSLYTKVFGLGIQTLEQPETQNQLQRATEYYSRTLSYFVDLVDLVAGVIRLVSALVVVGVFMPIFIPVVLVLALPYALNDRRYRGLLYRFGYDNTEGWRKASASASDLTLLRSLQEIYTIGAFKYFSDKFTSFGDWYNKTRLGMLRPWTVGNQLLGLVVDGAVLWGMYVVFKSALQGAITLGTVTFQIGALTTFRQSVLETTRAINDLFEYSLQLKDTYYLFKAQTVVPDGQKLLPKCEAGPEIVFENVYFKYPNTERFIYKNLNLKISAGEKIALVGPNGVGKTTLVKLLCRFYAVTSGKILVNGYNLNDLQITSLYKNMSLFFQDYQTYPQLTVKENIIVGDPAKKVVWSEVLQAAKNADCLDFIKQYKNGFDQVLSEQYKGGVRPSTGQWQKIVLARFFYRNSPLVVFDEPTSAIDAVSEAKIFDRIYQHFKNKTVIIVSHRFSTVRHADRIIVLSKGQIVEQGSHQELMKKKGQYAKAFALQAQGYSSETVA